MEEKATVKKAETGNPPADSYEIVFVKNGKTVYSEEVDYEEIFKVLRRYHYASDVLEILR